MRLELNKHDVAEILSSMALANMDFARRIALAPRGSLPLDQPLVEVLDSPADSDGFSSDAALFFGLEGEVDLLVGEQANLASWSNVLMEVWGELPIKRLTFCTSGSTGSPVAVTHDLTLLAQEVRTLARALAGARRVVAHVPRHHIYGFLFAVMLPKALGVPCSWRNPMPAPGLTASFEPGDLVIAHPLFWRTLAEGGLPFRHNVRGTTSTGPCPAELSHTLKALGLERLSEIYGSSETSGIGIRHVAETPYELMSHWNRLKNGRLSRRHPRTGRRLAYIPQDELVWDGERSFRPTGRKDKAVQVAGVNVIPKRVSQILLEHPGVLDCAVRLMRPDEGVRLKAAVVVNPTMLPLGHGERDLHQWLRARLTRYEMPGSVRFVTKLPVNSLGKLQDWD
ncbi:MAG: AMP-binding protein [Proteobacteria bacterium]|nr:AMP-binding protein [Pseudomonadota bacterium]MBU1595061.1 AMP-binding protein [Pseudomonadota bacterium]